MWPSSSVFSVSSRPSWGSSLIHWIIDSGCLQHALPYASRREAQSFRGVPDGDPGGVVCPHTSSHWVPLPQVFGFFKGMSFPLASIAVYNSVVFGVFSNTERFLSRHRCGDPEAGPSRSLSDLLLASMVAGMVSVGLGGPVDLIKIRLQMQTQPFREGKRPVKGNLMLRTCDLFSLGWIWGAIAC